jgi:hypothetical protein
VYLFLVFPSNKDVTVKKIISSCPFLIHVVVFNQNLLASIATTTSSAETGTSNNEQLIE